MTANEPTLYALGDGTYLMLPFDEDTVWFRVRTDLSSPGLDASRDHRILEQPDFAALVEEAGAVIRAMNAEAQRLGHPRVSEWDVADAYLAVRLDRQFNSKTGANP